MIDKNRSGSAQELTAVGDELWSRWLDVMGPTELNSVNEQFMRLYQAYTNDRRNYHDENYLIECLRTLDKYSLCLEKAGCMPRDIAIALFYHRSIIDQNKNWVELCGAEAYKYLDDNNFDQRTIAIILHLIDQTDPNKKLYMHSSIKPKQFDIEARAINDIILTPLSDARDTYKVHRRNMMLEYVNNGGFMHTVKKVRRNWICHLLEKSLIYKTEWSHNQGYETNARNNLLWELKAFYSTELY